MMITKERSKVGPFSVTLSQKLFFHKIWVIIKYCFDIGKMHALASISN